LCSNLKQSVLSKIQEKYVCWRDGLVLTIEYLLIM